MPLLTSLAVTALLALAPAAGARAADAPLFQFEQQARQHCPDDVVVWLNPSAKVYSFKGERWYGATKHGVYVCRREGDRAGNRPGQEPIKDQAPSDTQWLRRFIGG